MIQNLTVIKENHLIFILLKNGIEGKAVLILAEYNACAFKGEFVM